MKIICVDDFAIDYHDEYFINLPRLSDSDSHAIVNIVNRSLGEYAGSWLKVVNDDYVLQPGSGPCD